MDFIDISRIKDLTFDRFRECTPRLLVVADGNLNFGAGTSGLNRFVATLQATIIHGMTPIVTTRDRHADGTDSAFNDLDIARFDVVFLFGWNGETDPLTDRAYSKLAHFMQHGGGLFATGDHQDMGAGMCGRLPRVRSMRFWASGETPDIANATRLTTNRTGDDNTFEFDDQSDSHPQVLYANFSIPSDQFVFFTFPPFPSTKVRAPHPILRMGDGSALDVYPDHPHEGECRLPTNFQTTFDLDGATVTEWPGANPFLPFPAPRHVASTMSYGNGFDTGPTGPKDAVVPRGFIALAAYNGHPQKVGRVVTDATWHHYVNVNLTELTSTGTPDGELEKIQRFYSNLATWLMPVATRKCLWPWFVFETLRHHPLAEEIRIPTDGDLPVAELQTIGASIAAAIDRHPGSGGLDLFQDVLHTIVDPDRFNTLFDRDSTDGREYGSIAAAVVTVVIGAAVVEIVRDAANGKLEHGPEAFDRIARDSTQRFSRHVFDGHREDLARAMSAVDVFQRLITD